MRRLLTLPDLLGLLRFVLALVLLVLASGQQQTVFVLVLVTAFLLDAVDGPIARHLGLASAQGARLDTVADSLLYAALVIGVWRLWPAIFMEQLIYISMAAVGMLFPFSVAMLKYRTFTSYHTWLVKFATVCIASGSVILLLGGPSWPFQLASIISLVAGIEQVIITLMLDSPRADVRHLYAVYRQSRQADKDARAD